MRQCPLSWSPSNAAKQAGESKSGKLQEDFDVSRANLRSAKNSFEAALEKYGEIIAQPGYNQKPFEEKKALLDHVVNKCDITDRRLETFTDIRHTISEAAHSIHS